MAEERIQLTLGGKYDAGDAFNQMNTDVKSVQKSAKDMTQSFSGGIRQIAGQLDGELGNALNTTATTISSLAKGGLWGLLATAATMAIGYIVEKWNEAKEAAVKFAEICRNEVVEAINSAGNRFKDVSNDIATAKTDAKDMLDVLNGATAQAAQMKIHELHIETLQKITDDMSQASIKVLEANEKYETQLIKNGAAIEMAENAITNAAENVKLAGDKRLAAEQSLEEITQARIDLENQMTDYGRGWLAKRQEIQNNIEKNEQMYNDGLIDQHTFLQNNKKLKLELEKLENENQDQLKSLNAASAAELEAKKALSAAQKEEEIASRKLNDARKKEEETILAANAALEDANKALNDATKLQEKENEAKRQKIEQEELERLSAQERLDLMEATNRAERTALNLNIDKNYLVEEYKNLISEGLSKEEAYNNMTQRINEILKGREQIEKYCAQYGIDSLKVMETFNASMYEGNDVTEAYTKAMNKLNDILGERIDTEEDAISSSKKGKKSDNKNVAVNVKIDPSNLADGISNWDGKSAYQSAREQMKQDIAEQKQEQKTINNELRPFMNYINGNMPKDEADYYVKALVQKYSPEQLQDIYEKAQNKMLGKTESERKTRNKNIHAIKEALEKQGLK